MLFTVAESFFWLFNVVFVCTLLFFFFVFLMLISAFRCFNVLLPFLTVCFRLFHVVMFCALLFRLFHFTF